jgi:hypothetical protein
LNSEPGNPRTFAEKDMLGLMLQKASKGPAKTEAGLENDFMAVAIQDVGNDTVVGLQKASKRMMISGAMTHIGLSLSTQAKNVAWRAQEGMTLNQRRANAPISALPSHDTLFRQHVFDDLDQRTAGEFFFVKDAKLNLFQYPAVDYPSEPQLVEKYYGFLPHRIPCLRHLRH